MRWSYGRFSDSPFFEISHPPPHAHDLDRPKQSLSTKDAPGRPPPRVQFTASKNVVRWSYGRFNFVALFCLFLESQQVLVLLARFARGSLRSRLASLAARGSLVTTSAHSIPPAASFCSAQDFIRRVHPPNARGDSEAEEKTYIVEVS